MKKPVLIDDNSPTGVIDICIVTCNRLEYLKRCIWSIIASTSVKYRILVIDDASTDGTKGWLKTMIAKGLVHKIILNEKKIGAARNFNAIIGESESQWFVMANDDMYFYRWWEYACFYIVNRYPKCGIVSFYDYTRLNLDKGNKVVEQGIMKVDRTGLGASFVFRDSFDAVGGFYLPEGKIMGFFTTSFCAAFKKAKALKNEIYSATTNYAHHMDLPKSKLSEREFLKQYNDQRNSDKY